ncbi:hypothetical protein F0562_002275 [Nyssa sinensis]|uniref:TF-B3 domain-containing protein n=1 Tax=Nyssa sinensis TaxID=561372 RepID=A0A5J5CAE1_9ASTE|nr:hypothetical protein F0562_002275 [Nyssa sinensis]
MSESTDESGLGDEKGKKTKRNPSPEHEEKQNLSPTTTLTTAVASLPELSGETTHREGTITLSPSKKRSRTTQDNNQSSIDTTSESEPRQEKLLFEKKLTRTETRSSHNNGLVIPQKYWGHFPALETTNKGGPSDWKQIYCFDDREKRERKMTVRPHGDKLVIRKGWIKFVKDHNLQANDVVRFYKPNQPEEGNSNFILTSTKSNMPNRDDSSIEDKNDRDEDDSTVGGNIEQGDDEDDRTDGDSSEQGDDEDDSADEDCNEEEDDEEDDSSERDDDDDEDDNTDD